MTTERAIPSAGPDFEHLLQGGVVIVGRDNAAPTGAQAVAPDHSPRAPLGAQARSAADALPPPALAVAPELQREIEQLVYAQAELLDGKHWQAYIDLFAEDGVYWVPVTREQASWEWEPSIFAEDKRLMEIRMGRITHPNAWSQAPMWETNHVVSQVAVESASEGRIVVRSRFHLMELRRDQVRHFGGRYRHTLVRDAAGALRIQLQRVDLFNSQAPFDYVIQIWV